MNLNKFLLEDYYEQHEFKTQYMLSSSDPETWSLQNLLDMATQKQLQLWNNQTFGYTEVRGLPLLRETIVKQLYPQFLPDNVLCFAGAEEGIFCSLLTLCSAQDHVIVVTPCYQSLKEIPQFVGCAVTEVALEEKSNWNIDIDSIAAAIKPNTKVVVINFPHNPTGQIISQQELQELVLLLKKHDIWLFSDEVYRLLSHQSLTWADPAAVLYDKAISLGVMSKAYGLPGLRIGWIACQDKTILQQITQAKHYTSLCSSGPAEILAAIALDNQKLLLNRNRKILSKNIAILDMFFSKYSDCFSWVRPQAGCTGFVRYKGKLPIESLCQQVREQQGVLLLPSSVYDVQESYFRIGFGRSNMQEALQRFEHFLQSEGC
ncbi:MAG: aminotransferase [Epsilonproteobacteria bacterium]|nr:aminotransferase [Campylobacterota bacterium]